MSFDVVPLELLAAALIAVLTALPVSVPLAAGATAGPRERWNAVGLALGGGLLLGVLGAIVLLLAGDLALAALLARLAQVPGLLLLLAAAILSLLRATGPTLPWVLGLIGCLLTGLGEPLQALPALGGISNSALVLMVGVVAEAVVVVVIVGLLVAVAARAEVFGGGLAVGGAVGALVLLIALMLPHGIGVIVQVVLIVLGIVAGVVLSAIRSRAA
ncbi:hypothetical protein V1260_05395 [Brachybacterium sp. J144]|uniref:hypothetical protein n=1 Tax=Brachybacterium sp. J144 TaxID=3116487 RepID=UPI002E794EA4|nr:hypothetical protein [Brachybacterium sp. J144]MEE1650221.1 hypothetical protein [Brachybacterium sp. J144]